MSPVRMFLKMTAHNLLYASIGVGVFYVFAFLGMAAYFAFGGSIFTGSVTSGIAFFTVLLIGIAIAIFFIVWRNKRLYKRIKGKSEVSPSKYAWYVVLIYAIFASTALFIAYAFVL